MAFDGTRGCFSGSQGHSGGLADFRGIFESLSTIQGIYGVSGISGDLIGVSAGLMDNWGAARGLMPVSIELQILSIQSSFREFHEASGVIQ